MTYVAHHHELDRFFGHFLPTTKAAVAAKPGILRRVFEAIYESRMRSAERDIARYFERSGGMLTDNVEREMTERLLNNNWNVRR